MKAHPHHNYCFGWEEADLTTWLEYFVSTLAEVFEAVRLRAERCGAGCRPAEPEALRRLDHRARAVLGLFACKIELGLSDRTARNLLKGWTADGWLEVADPSRRGRAYSLSAFYRQLIGSSSEKQEWAIVIYPPANLRLCALQS